MPTTYYIKNFLTRATFRGKPTIDYFPFLRLIWRYFYPLNKKIQYASIKTLPRLDGSGDIEYALIKPDDFTPRGFSTSNGRYRDRPKKLVYVSHGVGRSLDEKSIKRWGYNATQNYVDIVVHNYPTYGDTPGPATEERINADTEELLRHVKKEGQEVVVLGNSIGCGPTMWLATSERTQDLGIKKVILISAWTSLLALWSSLVPELFIHSTPHAEKPPLSLKRQFKHIIGIILSKIFAPLRYRDGYDSFQSIKQAKNLAGKDVLMIHGEFDRTVPPSHCYQLKAEIDKHPNIKARLEVLRDCGHVFTRLWSDDIIWGFVYDTERLDEIIETAKDRKGPPKEFLDQGNENLGDD
ncbi:Alpha/Beta hydrolase protein [Pyronema omphalodes]|nr:Alpha/Beta hydrolase protein [Pyronema omphalodes]